MMVATRAHGNQYSPSFSSQQQPEGWRFVPDTILPGYQWDTPVGPGKDTHGTLGPDQRESRGWPMRSDSTVHSAETRPNMVAEQCRSRARALVIH